MSVKRETRARQRTNVKEEPIYIDSECSDTPVKLKRKADSDSDFEINASDSENKACSPKKRRKIKTETANKKTIKKVEAKPRKRATKTSVKKVKNEVKNEPEETKENVTNMDIFEPNPTQSTSAKLQKKYVGEWLEYELLAEKENIHCNVAKSITNLLEAGNTIPFIARYRKHITNDMSPEKLRDVKDSYEEICALKTKASSMLKVIEKSGKLSPGLKHAVLSCKNLTELEHIYAPFKPESKKTLAARAKSLGLEEPAIALLTGSTYVEPRNLVQPNGPDGLKKMEDVEKGLMHIIAHNIATDTEVLKFIRELRLLINMTLESKKSSNIKKAQGNESKFENYFNFKIPVKHIKPHQVLAINRGESQKILSVKVVVPDFAFNKFQVFCHHHWIQNTNRYNTRIRIFDESIKDAFKRLISPLIVRQTRAELKTIAEKASVEVFTNNLKKLLLGTPLKGKPIMGIDPGFQVGCKIAVVSPLGSVLDTGVIYPHTRNKQVKQEDHIFVRELLLKHNCSLIALGNGTACRETENWLTDLIKSKVFSPLDVSYTIVSECGASIYSCSPEAKKEFPKLDSLLISAVSLARRVQDPLAELVKVEPKHLGVGMYQHDVNKKILDTALEEVVTECVSFVGVDINTASQCLLRRVAGMSAQRADNILKYRETKGPFTNRYQLKDVKGIGDKIFEQCAGFLRVGPLDAKQAQEFYEKPDTMPLDCTWIHPESYDLAEKIIYKFKLDYKQIGQPKFMASFTSALQLHGITGLAKEFNSSEATVKLICDVLSRPLDHDLRQENPQEPLFRMGVTSINDIKIGMVVTGRVNNVTHFGAFVDIGVENHGLIHNTAMRGFDVQLGDRVEVKVLNIDISRNRIGLTVERKL